VSDRSDAVIAWEALYRAQVAVLRQLRAEFPDGGTSLTEYDVLFNLSRQPGHALRIRDLNKHLLLTQPSVSRLLDRLAAKGLVAKSGDPDDARAKRFDADALSIGRDELVSHREPFLEPSPDPDTEA